MIKSKKQQSVYALLFYIFRYFYFSALGVFSASIATVPLFIGSLSLPISVSLLSSILASGFVSAFASM